MKILAAILAMTGKKVYIGPVGSPRSSDFEEKNHRPNKIAVCAPGFILLMYITDVFCV